ncbi:ATP-grasp domain-containing protein [Natranaerofaba carboxydovora]|uniref:ATP-grasp domain-containing protein n=1 Tax=Natranaerofaba carboxydovora TaxID=2742683 RepID=UPI001F136C8C|nr:ATP-grasp domain-containing protein [Natranaerofaba carboxydovora]UMZ72926.1 ATP-grasp domain protein [Natranaerofaba carboxydovora]
MIILDKPYVSNFLQNTIIKLDLPVLHSENIEELNLDNKINLIKGEDFINKVNEKGALVYSNSENSIDWITKNLSFTDLPEKIDVFKDKLKFRELLKDIYPDFFYKEVNVDGLKDFDINEIEMPFVIKPSIGFFSIGVYKVSSISEWKNVTTELKTEVNKMAKNYPVEVIDTTKFIVEENIEGEEFAVDLYYDKDGRPVILNILKHIFSSEEDVSDRVYITSKEIIEENHDQFVEFLDDIGEMVELKNFPMHIEFRFNNYGALIPIEVNPLRFAGWCTTDVAYYAYGINVYEYYFKQIKPDWKEILKNKEDKIYSIVIADLPEDIDVNEIVEVDYDKFRSHFEKPLEMRKIDYVKHGVFAFLFAETDYNNWQELEEILKSSLEEYLKFKN